jgi:hypothetical protein
MNAQRRMISSALWSDLDFVSLTPVARLLWLALISNADDQGRLQGHPALVRSVCFPAEDMSLDAINDKLKAIERMGWIILYESSDKQYIQIAKWWKHQTMTWAQPSQYPAPDGWTDSLRYRVGDRVVTENWDNKPSADVQSTHEVHTNDSGNRATLPDNITEHNLTEQKVIVAAAPPVVSLLPKRLIDHETLPEPELLREIMHAFQRGTGQDETQALPAGKAHSALRQLLDDKRTMADIEAYARYLKAGWWGDKSLTVNFLADGIGQWIALGRPRKPNGQAQPRASPKVNAAGLTYNDHTAAIIRGDIPDGSEWRPVEVQT